MNEERKEIMHTSLYAFTLDFQEHVQQGWEMDPNAPATMWGFCYQTGLVRSDKTVAALQSLAGGAPPKMTRAEALQVARAARAEKRAQQGATQ